MDQKKDGGMAMDTALSKLEEYVQRAANNNVGKIDLSPFTSEIRKISAEGQAHQNALEEQISELYAANEELQIQRSKFAGIFALAPLGNFILDESGRIEHANPQGMALLGLGSVDPGGVFFQSFIVPEDRERFYNFQQTILETRIAHSCQLRLLSFHQNVVYAQLEGTAISNLPMSAKQYYIAVIDITERIEAETKLADTKQRLELALEASSAGTWEIDLKTGYFFLDESNHELCGIKPGSFDGKFKSFIALVHPDDRRRVDEHFRRSLNNEKEIDLDFRVLNSGTGFCYVSLRGHIVADPVHGKRFVGTLMNITEKKLLEHESVKLKSNQDRQITAAILSAQEHERKRISEALHDSVSQLLYGIKLNLQQLNGGDTVTGPHLDKIKGLIDAAINETRNISFELAPPILADFGLTATIKEMAKRLSNELLSIKVSAQLTNRLPLSLEINIFRILQELINNCIKHSGANEVSVAIKDEEGSILIRVRDNGNGFKERKKDMYAGSGLSSIRNRLSLYHGTLELESEPGKGTVAYIAIKKPAETA